MTTAYTNADEVRASWVNSNLPSGSATDLILNTLASRVSREIDSYTKREDGYWVAGASSVRYFTGQGHEFLQTDDFAGSPVYVKYAEDGNVDDVSGSGGSYVTLDASDYFTTPYNANAMGMPNNGIEVDALNGNFMLFTRYPRNVKVAAFWGDRRDGPRDEIKQAAIRETIRAYKRAEQSFNDVGANKDLGKLLFANAMSPETQLMIGHLKQIVI